MKVLQKYMMICAMMIATGIVHAQSFTVIESEMNVNGTSSMHDWTSEVTQLEATGNLTIENGQITNISGVEVKIPVVSIKSTKGSVMDNKTWDAFNHEKNPTISFKMTNLSEINKESYGYSMRVKGRLSMAGSSRQMTLEVECSEVGNNIYEFSGIHNLKMTEYGMSPPTALFGTLKTGDDVSIDFKIKIRASN